MSALLRDIERCLEKTYEMEWEDVFEVLGQDGEPIDTEDPDAVAFVDASWLDAWKEENIRPLLRRVTLAIIDHDMRAARVQS